MQRRRLHKKNDEDKKEKQFLKLTLRNTMVHNGHKVRQQSIVP